MERHFTARFYRVRRADNRPTRISEAIEAIEAMPSVSRRYDARTGLPLRLETVVRRSGLVLCDMSRIQADDKPGNLTPDGIEPLDADELGYAFSFLYDPQSDTITIMHDQHARIRAVLDYLNGLAGVGPFLDQRIFTRASLSLLQDASVKLLRVKLAQPDSAPRFQAESNDIEREILGLASALDAPYIDITATVGNKRSALSRSGVVGFISAS